MEVVDTRTKLLSATQLLDQVALDRYSFLRDAYLAQRRDAIYDGAPPLQTFDDDPGEGPAGKATAVPAAAAAAVPAPAAKSVSSAASVAPAASAAAAASAATK